MLRASCAVNVHAPAAGYDIQFGFIERSKADNTTQDVDRFEVAAHRFADLSCSDFGVASPNDSKYGCSVRDNVVELTHLGSPVHPDPDADRGHQVFTYSLLPHE